MNRNFAKIAMLWMLSLLIVPGMAAPAKKPGVAQPAADTARTMPELSAADLKKIEEALPAKASATPKKPRKLLVFWRCEGFFHGNGIAAGAKAIVLMGQKTGAYTTDVSADYAAFDAANLVQYDAVVLNNTTKLALPDEAKKKALLDFVKSGKGLIGIHAATDNFYDWPEAAQMLGGTFSGHPWRSGGTWAVKLDEPGHVLNRSFGGQGFKIVDEIYQFKAPYSREQQRVLLALDLSDPVTAGPAQKGGRADKDYAVAWIKQFGSGRVFYGSLGHAGNVFQIPAVLQFYLDGIQYALGDLEADATPRK
ncbi:MAG: ThuA domain-containing protein [Kiritimatiellaeota bacterium]|nr:ThuA domain-containing protein [Kiritimatiellota bacterium]